MKSNKRGFLATFMVLLIMIALSGFMVLLVDLGRAYIAKTQMRAMADGAALAAIQAYANDDCSKCPTNHPPTDVDRQKSRVDTALEAGQRVADYNPIMTVTSNRPVPPGSHKPGMNLGRFSSIQFLHYDGPLSVYTVTDPYDPNNETVINAVQVSPLLGSNGNGQFKMVFSSMVPGMQNQMAMATQSIGTIDVQKMPLDVIFAVDASGSMTTKDMLLGTTARYEIARLTAMALMNQFKTWNTDKPDDKKDQIGVVMFNDTYYSPAFLNRDSHYLTKNYDHVRTFFLVSSFNALYNSWPPGYAAPYISKWVSGFGWPNGQDYLPPNVEPAYNSGIKRDGPPSSTIKSCYNASVCSNPITHDVAHVGTNVEMALSRAFWMLRAGTPVETDHDNPRQRVIILISDGEPAQGYRTDMGPDFGTENGYGVPSNYVGVSRQEGCMKCAYPNIPAARAIRVRDAKLANNVGTWTDPQTGKKSGIIVYAIGIGTDPASDYEQFMRRIAGNHNRDEKLGGYFVNVADLKATILEILRKIRSGNRLVK